MKDQTVTHAQKTATITSAPSNACVLQRKCACGQHTIAGGECAECRQKRNQMQNIASNRYVEAESAPSIAREGSGSPDQFVNSFNHIITKSRFNHDFSQMPVNAIQSMILQPKLKINQPRDKYEQEADRIANRVMLMPEPPLIQPNNNNSLAPNRANRGTAWIATPESNGRVGLPLEPSLRAFFEPRFGRDFRNVRIHADAKGTQMTQAINAKAFTFGGNIYFDQGHYSPHSYQGKRLLAHELTHTIQQGATCSLQNVSGSMTVYQNSPPEFHQAESGMIQREVGAGEVASASEVLGRIQENNQAADEFIASHLSGLAATNHPAINWIRNLFRLFYQARSFNPGAARDAAGNSFVYTCRGGWIDLGHFFISALVGYFYGYRVAMMAGWLMESPVQEFFYRIARALDPADLDPEIITEFAAREGRQLAERVDPRFGGVGEIVGRWIGRKIQDLVSGNARSYFTIEDLPSDQFGSRLGDAMRNNSQNLFPLGTYMATFFSQLGGVHPTGDILDRMIEETIPGGIPRQHRSTTPYLLQSAAPLCTGLTSGRGRGPAPQSSRM